MSTTLNLPAPKRTYTRPGATSAEEGAAVTTESDPGAADGALPEENTVEPNAPSYDNRCRLAAQASQLTPQQRQKQKIALFIPRSLKDFDDGGAFPEIHVAQYPRHLGNPHLNKNASRSTGSTVKGAQSSASSRALVNVEIDASGEVSYDAIVKGGSNSDKLVYTKLDDIKGGDAIDKELPTEDEEEATRQRTQAALQALISNKTSMSKPSGSALANAATSQNQESKTQFIKYTPRQDAPGYNPAAATRVIQMVPKQLDPMNPPKHKHLKAPRGPAEDPVPILHAPPPKLSKEERQEWDIPAPISNWKNARGFTIPLDKRLAADGRGLREKVQVNSNFATFAESLYVAEQQAREEVKLRAQVQKQLSEQEQTTREEELRNLAQQARLQASSGGGAGNDGNDTDEDDGDTGAATAVGNRKVVVEDAGNESEGDVAARQRDRLRLERKKEREREQRFENSQAAKKAKLEEGRDVSEKIALGQNTGAGGGGGEDARLYNQSAGMDSGFGADDDYNTYSKPLFAGQQAAQNIYRPTRGDTEYTADEQYDKLVDGASTKFAAGSGKGFAGGQGGTNAAPRTAPVQFEKK